MLRYTYAQAIADHANGKISEVSNLLYWNWKQTQRQTLEVESILSEQDKKSINKWKPTYRTT